MTAVLHMTITLYLMVMSCCIIMVMRVTCVSRPKVATKHAHNISTAIICTMMRYLGEGNISTAIICTMMRYLGEGNISTAIICTMMRYLGEGNISTAIICTMMRYLGEGNISTAIICTMTRYLGEGHTYCTPVAGILLGGACEGKPLLIPFGPEPVHVPFGTEYKPNMYMQI